MAPVPVPTRLGEMLVPDIEEDVIGRFLHHYGEWAWDEVGFVASVLPDGARVLDIGAFVGTFGLGLAARKPVQSVCFVEANTATIPLLKANVGANAPCPTAVVEALVVGTTGYSVVGRADNGNFGSASFAPGASGEVLVDSAPDQVTLAELRTRHGPFDLIKLDVEGLELEILAADADVLRNGKIAIWAECNDTAQSLRLVELLLSWDLPVHYFAFPSHNPDNHKGSESSIFPMAYEAGLLAAPGIEPCMGSDFSRHGCILRSIDSVGDLKEIMWRTPRWSFPEWEKASHAELVALAGHALCGDGFDRYLQPAWKPGEPLAVRLTRAETEASRRLDEAEQVAAAQREELARERERADVAEDERQALVTQIEALSSRSESEREAARRRLDEAEQVAAAQCEELARARERADVAEDERQALVTQVEDLWSRSESEREAASRRLHDAEQASARMSARFLDQKSLVGRATEQVKVFQDRAAAADKRASEAEVRAVMAGARAQAADAEADRAHASALAARYEAERAMTERDGALRRVQEIESRLARLSPVHLGRLSFGLYRDTTEKVRSL